MKIDDNNRLRQLVKDLRTLLALKEEEINRLNRRIERLLPHMPKSIARDERGPTVD
jgi:hypothetical protein